MRGPQNKLYPKVYTFLIKTPTELPIKNFLFAKTPTRNTIAAIAMTSLTRAPLNKVYQSSTNFTVSSFEGPKSTSKPATRLQWQCIQKTAPHGFLYTIPTNIRRARRIFLQKYRAQNGSYRTLASSKECRTFAS